MKIRMTPLGELTPYAGNARTHTEAQIAQIAASIEEFGFTNPILAGSDGVIIAGHGRLLAAERLGLGKVPVITLEHLDERHGPAAYGSAGELHRAFPPGPGNLEAWRDYLRHAPHLEPSLRRGSDGLAHRVDRLRLCGNGVVPLVAAHALRVLAAQLLADG